MTDPGPPRVAIRLIRALLPAEERDFVLGDLEEDFRRRADGEGRRRATARYLYDGARSALSLMTRGSREGMLTGWGNDLRSALRVFRREPGFALVVVVMLALGVGGATAVYSVLRGVVLSPLELDDPDRVVVLWGRTPEYPRMPLTVGDHKALAEGVDAFASIGASWGNTALLVGEGEPRQVRVGWVTPGYLDVVGAEPLLGRSLVAGDLTAVVISHGLWIRAWGADPDVIGRPLRLPEGSFEIVGVLPPDRNPNLSSFAGVRTAYDVWRLQPPEWLEGEDRSVGWLRTTARLRDGVTLAQAQAETDALMTAVNRTVTERDGGTDLRVDLVGAKEDLVGEVSRTLWILLASVVGVLLIAASNVANLTLARGEARRSEMALRATLGGSRSRLIRQLLVESGVLAVAGGASGLAVASVGLSGLLALAPPGIPRMEAVGLDWSVLAFAMGATGVAAVVFGVVPALRFVRGDLSRALVGRRATPDRGQRTLSRALVVGEVALSLTLLTATGLLLRSMSGLDHVDLGLRAEGLMTFAVEVPEWGDTAEDAAATMSAFIEGMASVPGVRSVAFTNRIPLGGGIYTGTFRSEEMVAGEAPTLEASIRWVTPDFFTAFGTDVLMGRAFRADDGPAVAILDRRAADRLWPDGSPLGRRLQLLAVGEEPQWVEVVGVVEPMKHAGVAEPAEETIFRPMLTAAHRQNFRYAAVRVGGEPLAYVDPLEDAARAVDGDAVLARIRTMEDLVRDDVAATRFAGFLLTVFGGVALLLAIVGLHGIMAHSVRRRTREIGIRVALGAERRQILRKAVASGGVLVGSGIVLGLMASLGLGGVLRSILFGVEPSDPASILGACVIMLTAGLTGAYLPARWVMRLDPATTLREE